MKETKNAIHPGFVVCCAKAASKNAASQ